MIENHNSRRWRIVSTEGRLTSRSILAASQARLCNTLFLPTVMLSAFDPRTEALYLTACRHAHLSPPGTIANNMRYLETQTVFMKNAN